jgi:hypothetical protein
MSDLDTLFKDLARAGSSAATQPFLAELTAGAERPSRRRLLRATTGVAAVAVLVGGAVAVSHMRDDGTSTPATEPRCDGAVPAWLVGSADPDEDALLRDVTSRLPTLDGAPVCVVPRKATEPGMRSEVEVRLPRDARLLDPAIFARRSEVYAVAPPSASCDPSTMTTLNGPAGAVRVLAQSALQLDWTASSTQFQPDGTWNVSIGLGAADARALELRTANASIDAPLVWSVGGRALLTITHTIAGGILSATGLSADDEAYVVRFLSVRMPEVTVVRLDMNGAVRSAEPTPSAGGC